MAKKRYTFEELQIMDEEIFALAAYEASGGMIFVPKDEQDFVKFNLKLAKSFNYFKAMLRAGEVDMFELKDLVYTKNGAVPQADEDDIDKLIEGIERETNDMEQEDKLTEKLAKTIGSLFQMKQQNKGDPVGPKGKKGEIGQPFSEIGDIEGFTILTSDDLDMGDFTTRIDKKFPKKPRKKKKGKDSPEK